MFLCVVLRVCGPDCVVRFRAYLLVPGRGLDAVAW